MLFRSESTEFLFLLSGNLFCLEPAEVGPHESEEDLFLDRCPFSLEKKMLIFLIKEHLCSWSCFEAGLKKSIIDCFLSPGLSVFFPAAAGTVLPGLRWQRGGDDPGAGDEGKPGLAGMQRLVMSAPLATAA